MRGLVVRGWGKNQWSRTSTKYSFCKTSQIRYKSFLRERRWQEPKSISTLFVRFSASHNSSHLIMAVVIYNAALAAQLGNPHPVLIVGQQQLAPYAHSRQGRGVLALPGQDVPFVRDRITAGQIWSHRYYQPLWGFLDAFNDKSRTTLRKSSNIAEQYSMILINLVDLAKFQATVWQWEDDIWNPGWSSYLTKPGLSPPL
jgi:hypothetical protein